MKVLGSSGCAFVNSGYVDTSRSFPHDVQKYPFTYEMLRSSDLQMWTGLGFEVGAHTVNHLDLGTCSDETASFEIAQCGQDLQKITGRQVNLFSFPFGRLDNIRPPARLMIQAAGYVALFSAHGGFVGPRTDPHDIPRVGAFHDLSPIYCLLLIEGITAGQVAAGFRKIWRSVTEVTFGRRGST